MGLEGVEIVLAVEESFDISIADQEAGEIRTTRQLIDLVLRKVQTTDDSNGCITRRAFHLIRRTVGKNFGAARNAVKPEVRMRTFVPFDRRRAQWHELQKQLGAEKWPKLTPGFVALTSAATAGISLAFLLTKHLQADEPISMTLVISLFLIPICLWFSKPLHRGIPHRCKTVGATAEYLARYNRHLFVGRPVRWNRDEVVKIVRGIVGAILGGKDFSDDDDFVKDLGMG